MRDIPSGPGQHRALLSRHCSVPESPGHLGDRWGAGGGFPNPPGTGPASPAHTPPPRPGRPHWRQREASGHPRRELQLSVCPRVPEKGIAESQLRHQESSQKSKGQGAASSASPGTRDRRGDTVVNVNLSIPKVRDKTRDELGATTVTQQTHVSQPGTLVVVTHAVPLRPLSGSKRGRSGRTQLTFANQTRRAKSMCHTCSWDV